MAHFSMLITCHLSMALVNDLQLMWHISGYSLYSWQVTRGTYEDGRLRGSSKVTAGRPEKHHHKRTSQEAPPTLNRTSMVGCAKLEHIKQIVKTAEKDAKTLAAVALYQAELAKPTSDATQRSLQAIARETGVSKDTIKRLAEGGQ
jgi:hypothetical protein